MRIAAVSGSGAADIACVSDLIMAANCTSGILPYGLRAGLVKGLELDPADVSVRIWLMRLVEIRAAAAG